MSAGAAIVALLILLAATWLTGRALLAAVGAESLRGLELGLGLGLLLPLAFALVQLPGHGTTAAIVLALGLLVALWAVRRDLTPPDPAALGAAAVALLVTGLPFIAQGRFGILGTSLNDDIGAHFALADALRLAIELPPSELISNYPVGPHALAGALASGLGTDVPATFTALLMLTAAASAATAATALQEAPAPLRALGGAATGIGFLLAGYYGQAAFKETLVALFVLVFAVGLERADGDRRALALLGLPVAGAVATYALPGAVWPALTALLYLAVRGDRRELVRGLGLAAAVVVVLSLPALGRVVDFDAAQVAAGDVDPKSFLGNLINPLPWREALGIWPAIDFRGPPTELDQGVVRLLGYALAVVVAAGFVWLLRRGRTALPAALAAAAAFYLAARVLQGPYVTAKSLVVLAPLTTVVALRFLFGVEHRLRVVAWAAGTVAALLMLWSSTVVLRSSPVGSLYQALDLRTLRDEVEDRDVLFLGYDNYVAWELMGARVAMTSPYSIQPAFPVELRPGKPVDAGSPTDPDAVLPTTLARAELAITTGAGYASRLAGDWRPLRRTALYTLWQRAGDVPDKQILEEGAAPGALLDCSQPPEGTALVLPEPVVGAGTAWTVGERDDPVGADASGFATVLEGATVRQRLDLPAGEWQLSLQYFGSRPSRIEAPALVRDLPPNLVARGMWWPMGTIRSDGGPTVVRFTVGRSAALGRTTALSLGALAATRPGGVERRPIGRACGRYLDGYQTG